MGTEKMDEKRSDTSHGSSWFTDQDDYAHALFEGPWTIADHYLLVQRWRPLFLPQETDIQKVAVRKVGKALRTMLKVDELTSIHFQRKFARICVEIDLRKKMVLTITAFGKEFNIVYEGLHQICFNCTIITNDPPITPEARHQNKQVSQNMATNQKSINEEKNDNHSNEELPSNGTQAINSGDDKDACPAEPSKKNNSKSESQKQKYSPYTKKSTEKKNSIPIIKGKYTAISKKITPAAKQIKQFRKKTKIIQSIPRNQDKEKIIEAHQSSKDKIHDEYWRQFSYLNKEIAKAEYVQPTLLGGSLDHTTKVLITSIMGSGYNNEVSKEEGNKSPTQASPAPKGRKKT
ncbi:hypothetical protein Ahy_B06g081820 [Arachis hypogaea]|uniref:DUF4283 domain-containing protein n=1 Tax=Arachis hypogaea TaxID=3818 RepID=A0A444YM05_ARAHY|nr:hypothetical protein Ahy_B06g081820 [Arachis hypogaea]